MTKSKSELVRISFRIPKPYYNALEKLVENGRFRSVAEAVRHAVNMLITHYKNHIH